VAYLLVVFDDVSDVVSARVMGLAHTHRVVGQIHVAVVAEECCAVSGSFKEGRGTYISAF